MHIHSIDDLIASPTVSLERVVLLRQLRRSADLASLHVSTDGDFFPDYRSTRLRMFPHSVHSLQ